MSRSRRPSPEPRARPERPMTRRELLAGTAAALGAGTLPIRAAAGTDADARPKEPQGQDPTAIQGRPPSELGQRSSFETIERRVNRRAPSGESETPLERLRGIITPADLHFERHHAGVPIIDPARYRLLIHGMVERPMVFGLEDLKRYPSRSQICFIECSGNGYRGYLRNPMKPEWTPQQIDGLTSTSEWTGVPVATLMREVGVRPGATWLLAESTDAAKMTRSIPIEKAWDDAMIAYGQNGEAIRPEQGYPARLLLPGCEGNAQVKWIRRIEFSDRPFMTREETSKYSDPLPDCTARLFSFEMDAKSVITFPAFPTILSPGWCEITGLAWSGRGRIRRVEVSTDGGRTWHETALQDPVLPKCHTRFRHLWRWGGEDALVMSRAVDETGYVQPTLSALRKVRGEGTFYHHNNIRAWRVQPDGRVFFAVEG